MYFFPVYSSLLKGGSKMIHLCILYLLSSIGQPRNSGMAK